MRSIMLSLSKPHTLRSAVKALCSKWMAFACWSTSVCRGLKPAVGLKTPIA